MPDDHNAAIDTTFGTLRVRRVAGHIGGEVLDLKLGTVRSRIHRGRSMLRKALAHRAPKAGRVRYSGPVEPVAMPT